MCEFSKKKNRNLALTQNSSVVCCETIFTIFAKVSDLTALAMSSVEERSLERVNFPYFDEDAYEKFFNWADRNVFDVEGLCLKIKSRESMV